MPETKKWHGTWPSPCQLCGRPLDRQEHFIDGATVYGPWALMCVFCHSELGLGLGTGKGQKYSSETLEKVEG